METLETSPLVTSIYAYNFKIIGLPPYSKISDIDEDEVKDSGVSYEEILEWQLENDSLLAILDLTKINSIEMINSPLLTCQNIINVIFTDMTKIFGFDASKYICIIPEENYDNSNVVAVKITVRNDVEETVPKIFPYDTRHYLKIKETCILFFAIISKLRVFLEQRLASSQLIFNRTNNDNLPETETVNVSTNTEGLIFRDEATATAEAGVERETIRVDSGTSTSPPLRPFPEYIEEDWLIDAPVITSNELTLPPIEEENSFNIDQQLSIQPSTSSLADRDFNRSRDINKKRKLITNETDNAKIKKSDLDEEAMSVDIASSISEKPYGPFDELGTDALENMETDSIAGQSIDSLMRNINEVLRR